MDLIKTVIMLPCEIEEARMMEMIPGMPDEVVEAFRGNNLGERLITNLLLFLNPALHLKNVCDYSNLKATVPT
jgi:hypothetical protein